ncbi:hypothetical protein MX850_07195 [Erysipelothrix sp. Poltava]|nr:hypothetical protein MX850_07195 [Erysipelothrix sp. Poltava]
MIAANDSKIYIDRAIQPLHIEIQKAYKPKKEEDIDISLEILIPNINGGKVDPNELLSVDGFVIQENSKQELKPNLEEILSVEGFSVNETIAEEPKNVLLPDPIFLEGYSIDEIPNHEFYHGMEAIMEKEFIKQKNLEQILEQDRKNRIAYELSIKEYEEQLKPISLENHLEGEQIELNENPITIENINQSSQKLEKKGLFNDNQQVYFMLDVNGHAIHDHPSFDTMPLLVGTEIPEEIIDSSKMDEAYKVLDFIETQKRINLERILLQDIENRIHHEQESEKIMNDLYKERSTIEHQMDVYEIAASYLIDGVEMENKNHNDISSFKETKERDALTVMRTTPSDTKSLKKDRTQKQKQNQVGTDIQNFDEKLITRGIENNKDSVLPKTGKQKHSNIWSKFLILTGVCVLLSKRYKNRIVK